MATIIICILLGLICSILYLLTVWYNGVLDVRVDEDGDDACLKIIEYDKVRTKKYMLIRINRKYS
ncbi:MAG: hypothetical protein ACRCTZ_09385 [Sarcina sp.]